MLSHVRSRLYIHRHTPSVCTYKQLYSSLWNDVPLHRSVPRIPNSSLDKEDCMRKETRRRCVHGSERVKEREQSGRENPIPMCSTCESRARNRSFSPSLCLFLFLLYGYASVPAWRSIFLLSLELPNRE